MSTGRAVRWPLIERDDLISRLRSAITEARGGHGGISVIEGEPGVGKSTLLLASTEIAAGTGCTVLRAAGSELERSFSFGVVLQLLDPYIRNDRAVVDHPLVGPCDIVRRLTDPTAAGGALADESAMLHGLYWFVAALAEESPLVMVVDDIQWADPASIRMLAFLNRRLQVLRVAVVLASRTEARPADTSGGELSAVLNQSSQILRPRALSRWGTGQVIQASLPYAVGEQVVAACYAVSGGNPFFLRSLIEELADIGRDTDGDLVERLAPVRVQAALRQRLADLPASDTTVVQAVAVLGDGSSPSAVAQLLNQEQRNVRAAASRLENAHILGSGPKLGFAHPILRAVAESLLTRSEAEDLHARAAHQLYVAEAPSERVASHLHRCPPGLVPGASEYLSDAAQAASNKGAPDMAAAHLRRALEEAMPGALRGVLHLRLGEACWRAGLPEAEVNLRALLHDIDVSHRLNAARALAWVLCAKRQSAHGIRVLVERARQCSEYPGLRLQLQAEILAIGDLDLSARRLAVEHGQQLGSTDAVSVPEPWASMLKAHEAVNEVMRCASATVAAELADQALRSGALIGAGAGGQELGCLTAYILMCAERYDDAERYLNQMLAAAQRAGAASGYAAASAWLSFVAHRRGDLPLGEAHARASLEVARASGLRLIEVTALMNLSWTLVDRGRSKEASDQFALSGLTAEDYQGFVGATSLDARGRIRIAAGDSRGGAADLIEAGTRIAELGLDNPACFPWRSGAARGLAISGGLDAALSFAADELRLARRWGTSRAIGLALRTLAQLVLDPDQAVELLQEATARLERSPARLEFARCQIELGCVHRRAGRLRDARTLLRAGMDLASACGAAADAERAGTELRVAGGRPPARLQGGATRLTPSEFRVATLAAAGLSNTEIAQNLFVTVKTVEMHLSASFRKLNVRSRGELPGVLANARK